MSRTRRWFAQKGSLTVLITGVTSGLGAALRVCPPRASHRWLRAARGQARLAPGGDERQRPRILKCDVSDNTVSASKTMLCTAEDRARSCGRNGVASPRCGISKRKSSNGWSRSISTGLYVIKAFLPKFLQLPGRGATQRMLVRPAGSGIDVAGFRHTRRPMGSGGVVEERRPGTYQGG